MYGSYMYGKSSEYADVVDADIEKRCMPPSYECI
jgi:hypothetical protein